jgi:hypothetical protein
MTAEHFLSFFAEMQSELMMRASALNGFPSHETLRGMAEVSAGIERLRACRSPRGDVSARLALFQQVRKAVSTVGRRGEEQSAGHASLRAPLVLHRSR